MAPPTAFTRIGFIGFGNMASAVANGIMRGSKHTRDSFFVSDPFFQNGSKSSKFRVADNNSEVAAWADVVILASKPRQIRDICDDISASLKERSSKPTIVSVAAGISIDSIVKSLKCTDVPVVRCMPNTPSLIGEGVTGFYANQNVTPALKATVSEILCSVGDVIEVDTEEQLHAVTAVSGSGPAYFFRMMEHLTNAGVAVGLPRDKATTLALKTARGASMLACNEHEPRLSPEELRRQVTSKNGTTEAGIMALDRSGFGLGLQMGVQAAYRRSIELAKEN